jgi:hypothetical protein
MMITRHATRTVTVPSPTATLFGDLAWPIRRGRVHGLTVVAHAHSGSRLHPRHQALAAGLNRAGLATLLTDLLAPDEDRWDARSAGPRHDVPLLTTRLVTVLERVARMEVEVAALPVALFGTGTSASAAVRAAAALAEPPPDTTAGPTERPPRPAHVDAVVSRAAEPDLDEGVLERLTVPSLFLVGEHDRALLARHRAAGVGEVGRTELLVVPGVADLVEDGAAAQRAAALAAEWLTARLDPAPGT